MRQGTRLTPPPHEKSDHSRRSSNAQESCWRGNRLANGPKPQQRLGGTQHCRNTLEYFVRCESGAVQYSVLWQLLRLVSYKRQTIRLLSHNGLVLITHKRFVRFNSDLRGPPLAMHCSILMFAQLTFSFLPAPGIEPATFIVS